MKLRKIYFVKEEENMIENKSNFFNVELNCRRMCNFTLNISGGELPGKEPDVYRRE